MRTFVIPIVLLTKMRCGGWRTSVDEPMEVILNERCLQLQDYGLNCQFSKRGTWIVPLHAGANDRMDCKANPKTNLKNMIGCSVLVQLPYVRLGVCVWSTHTYRHNGNTWCLGVQSISRWPWGLKNMLRDCVCEGTGFVIFCDHLLIQFGCCWGDIFKK